MSASQWRKFADVMPEKKQRVLVCWIPDDEIWDFDNTRVQVATFSNYCAILRLTLESEMVHGYFHLDLESVYTHWMPLPEPPK